jgi:hypothetical protein
LKIFEKKTVFKKKKYFRLIDLKNAKGIETALFNIFIVLKSKIKTKEIM